MPSNKAQTASFRFPAVLLCYTTASLLTSGSPGPTGADGAWWLLSPREIQGVLPNWFSWKVLIELSSTVEDGLMPVWKRGKKKKTLPTSPTPVCILCGDLTGKLLHPWAWSCSSVMSTLLEMQEMTCTLTWVETLNGPCVCGWCVCVWCPVQGDCWTQPGCNAIFSVLFSSFTCWILSNLRQAQTFRAFAGVYKRLKGENKGEYSAAEWWRESLDTNRSAFGERRGVEEEEEGDSD